MTVTLILAALFLPPLAVFLAEGFSRTFWIAFAFPFLGYVPGVVFPSLFLLRRRPPASPA